MKAAVIQPAYSTDLADAEKCFKGTLDALEACDPSLDLIVLPEACDKPALARGAKESKEEIARFGQRILDAAVRTAKRCRAVVAVNTSFDAGDGYRNTTHLIAPDGTAIGRYFKTHPVASECSARDASGEETGLDCGYSYFYAPPQIVEYGGIRYAFLTCYDFYFYENFSNIARMRPDVVIGCSNQRSDTHLALDVIGRFVAYNTGAYLVRASLSLGADSEVGGSSMIVAPTGEMLLDMKNRTGIGTAEFDPHAKYLKPMGFGNPTGLHADYTEAGRRPWLYRPAGPFVLPPDDKIGFPRVCAHRGFSAVAPENTMPAYGAAVALGADEIELDLWDTKDGVLVSCHDPWIDRCSDGTGAIGSHTLAELKTYDFGAKSGESFRGLEIMTFEEILRKFARQVVMNVHVKYCDGLPYSVFDQADRIVALLRKYDCAGYAYLMADSDDLGRYVRRTYPDVAVCASGANGGWNIVDRAIEYGYGRVQLYRSTAPDGTYRDEFDRAMIEKAHAHGIRCNLFWSDDPEEACRYIGMGVDCILTNDFLKVDRAVKARFPRKTNF